MADPFFFSFKKKKRTLRLDSILREGSQPLLYCRPQLLLCGKQRGIHLLGFAAHLSNVTECLRDKEIMRQAGDRAWARGCPVAEIAGCRQGVRTQISTVGLTLTLLIAALRIPCNMDCGFLVAGGWWVDFGLSFRIFKV